MGNEFCCTGLLQPAKNWQGQSHTELLGEQEHGEAAGLHRFTLLLSLAYPVFSGGEEQLVRSGIERDGLRSVLGLHRLHRAYPLRRVLLENVDGAIAIGSAFS